MIKFEWDSTKARLNQEKHGVSFGEAQTVFLDEQAIQFFDQNHSVIEDRFVMLGVSSRMRFLVVVHCERESGEVIRIISARKATINERNFYRGMVK
jgi:uncharacterized DUF497 family protein